MHDLLTHLDSGLSSLVDHHHAVSRMHHPKGGRRKQHPHIKAWSGSLGAAFSVDEASVKEATVAYFPLLSAVLTFRLCPWLREGFFVHIFCVKTHLILAQCVFVLHGHRICRDIVVLLIASVAIVKIGIFSDTAI